MTVKTVRNLRRLSQFIFFCVFLWLIVKTAFGVTASFNWSNGINLPFPVSIALQFDPLTALAMLLATGSLYKDMLWSLVILIPTIFLGRFFCGWVCPMGTLNHWISEIPLGRFSRKPNAKIKSNQYKKYQRIKYYILFFFLGAALVGILQVGLLDPLSLLARSLGIAVLPTLHIAASSTLNWIKGFGISPLTVTAQAIYDGIAYFLFPLRQLHFNTIFSIGLLFLLILILNRVVSRFWCRYLCPLGALLGLFSRFALLKLDKDESSCNQCQDCMLHCQGGANPNIGSRWRQSECHLCLNCQASCPNSSIHFTFFPKKKATTKNPPTKSGIDVTRRKVTASIAGGLAMWPLFRFGDVSKVNANPYLIRPPGALPEKDFMSRCIKCGQCIRVCPNNALHPTLLESGIEGVWTPVLIPRIGYCEPDCTKCGEVCPTGAITQFTQAQRKGSKESPPIRIGTAFFDHERCLPWATASRCMAPCEEWCPTSPKAITLKVETAINSDGNFVKVRRPYVELDLCTGCGACEYACLLDGKPGVYVTSEGESRSRDNQTLQKRKP
ncbi:MAG: 4Fe-4S binding protein [candidate division Zixibacteria bacterium]|nr:4Fe-4S binding protein [candidate division Zixibacteria bacterium]